MDAGVSREKLNATLLSRVSSLSKVLTAPTDDVCPDGEVPDEDLPPAMSFRVASDSDSYEATTLFPRRRGASTGAFQRPLCRATGNHRFLQESSYANSPPSYSSGLVNPSRMAHHIRTTTSLGIQRSFGSLGHHH